MLSRSPSLLLLFFLLVLATFTLAEETPLSASGSIETAVVAKAKPPKNGDDLPRAESNTLESKTAANECTATAEGSVCGTPAEPLATKEAGPEASAGAREVTEVDKKAADSIETTVVAKAKPPKSADDLPRTEANGLGSEMAANACTVVAENSVCEAPAEPSATEESGPEASAGVTEVTEADKKAADSAVSKEEENPSIGTDKVLRLLGTEVLPATSIRLAWSPSQHFEGVYSSTPVLVVNGAKPGPTLCLTAAIHGDELNGIETVRKVVYELDADGLHGAVIGVPIVNLQGFHRGSRYLTDRRDLNRHFPGDANGSSAARIAKSFFDEIVIHCDAIVDLHTGSFYRTNLPQLRGDLSNPKVVEMTRGFGSTVVLHSRGADGTLRRAAVNAGIPAVTLEAGAPMVLDEKSVNHSVKGIRTLLNQLDMVSKFRLWGDPEPVYYNSTWQRATTGGIIFSDVSLGQNVRKGDLLGTVTNPITNVRKEIRSEYNGMVIGMAMNQVVQPGFAAYHIGIQAPEEQISSPAQVTAGSEASMPAEEQAVPSQTSPSSETTVHEGPDFPAGESQELRESGSDDAVTEVPQREGEHED